MEFDPLDAMMNSQGALHVSAMKWIKERGIRIRIEIESKKFTIYVYVKSSEKGL